MTTRPFLYIDLMKSWREEQHPRDKYGRFTTVKGGSRVVTKQGKTGVVEKVTSTHYHIKTDDGKTSKVMKDNALHATDHAKVEKEKKKQARKKKATEAKAGKKQSATKSQKKADGTAKAKPIKDPTTKAAPKKKATASKPKAEVKPKAPAKTATKASARKLNAPELKAKAKTAQKAKTVTTKPSKLKEAKEHRITNYDSGDRKKVAGKIPQEAKATASTKAQTAAANDYKNAETDAPKTSGLDAAWNSAAVQKIMNKPVAKRSGADIQKVAGVITDGNDKLAHSLVNKKLAAMGLPQMKNKIGNSATKNPFTYETGLHGDLLQAARGAMYETLLKVMSGAENPGKGTAIGAHVVNRMKAKMNKDLYGMLNQIPAPRDIQPAIHDMKKHENELSQKLGRTPSDEELANHMEKHSDKFKASPIPPAPKFDDKTGQWVATQGKVKDPVERLKLLKQYNAIQRTASTDTNVGKEGEREVNIGSNIVDDKYTPHEAFERKERQKELEGALPKAMGAMGMSDESIKVWTLTHSAASETSKNRGQLSGDEVAKIINDEGGWNGKPVSRSWVAKWYAKGAEALKQAHANNHPALAQLKLFKSLFVQDMFKAVYEMELMKSLMSWGFDTSILRTKATRTAVADNMYELKKSLAPYEYVGSYVTTDEGFIHAKIVEHTVPKGTELVKAFGQFEDLQKALFSHKDGGNHAVNQKAQEYVKKNAKKYSGMANDQQARAKAKKGQLTWSEELLLKNPGSCWISWGGKRILINGSTGEIKYDSRNEAHREEHNSGAQEDKLDFQHETDEREEKAEELKKQASEAHSKGDYGKSQAKWAEAHGVKMKETTDDKGKKKKELDLDEGGNLQFDHSKMNFTEDHGTKAFEESLGDLSNAIKEHKADTIDKVHHKNVGIYRNLSDEEKEAYDKASPEERTGFVGNHLANREGVQDLLDRAQQMASEGKKGKEIQAELADELKALGDQHNSMALKNKDKMVAVFNGMGGKKPKTSEEIIEHLGAQEISRAREEANKKMLPEGHYEIGNKNTGESMIVTIGHRVDPKTGDFTSYVKEAFNPKTGEHFTTEKSENSWGQLGKALGMKNNSAESFIYESNKAGKDAVIQPMDNEEAASLRSNTKLGMQDNMTHKDFKKVDERRGKDGKVQSQTYAMDMPDGSQNVIEVDGKGTIKDPIMKRLLQQRAPITSADDLHDLLKNAVGNKTWVTTHVGGDVHVGDALGHHVQLMYDGKGAPRVVGGTYDGYRFIDTKDLEKGAIDPHTGEPVKALFRNGKLVDRKLTTNNKVDMKEGNAVMYQDGDKWKKGKIRASEGDKHQVVDSKGNLIGMFKSNELKHATEKGRTLSNSGQAVVKLKESSLHRMNPSEVFDGNDKAKALFEQALKKAKVRGAFDKDTGELKKDLELNDKQHQALNKVLGRSKAGKAIMKQFNEAKQPAELSLHVPEHLRSAVASEGVAVGKDGTATISVGKFEHLRNVLGGLSIDHKAQAHLQEHFKRKDRTPHSEAFLKKNYQPFSATGRHADFYRQQFNPNSFLSKETNPDGSPGGLYGTQLEGVAHLVERGRGIAGHGMGTGKTILGVVAALHHKAKTLAKGQKPKKTLVVSPKGIMSDWGKEIGSHTNSKALYIGSGMSKKDGSGKQMTNAEGKKVWGQDGTEQETTTFQNFKNNGSHASEDHDFHIVSYDTFMRNKDHFANSGLYDNICIDEVHAFKNQSGKRGGSLAETTDKFQNVWGLSGTPMENDAREAHSLIDTITGGKHELGSAKEFQDNYMMKDRNGKIVGVKPEKAKELGDVMANVIQFRGGEDVRYNNGDKIHFPHLTGGEATESNPNPQDDFVGNMVDRSRDHKTTDYYGTKHSVTDFDSATKTVKAKSGDDYEVSTNTPKNIDPNSSMGKMYATYNELQNKYLPASKLAELQTASATGFDNASGKKSQNYLTAMQKLQKYLNAPLAHKMYVPGGGNAIESNETDAQGEGKAGKKKSEPLPFETDSDGNKRYYESDGKGGYLKDAKGNPKLLPPLHHNNPKADYLKQRISKYLDSVTEENKQRRASGKPELMPKVVVKSAYTTFGTDIVDGVLRDLQREHPALQPWRDKVGESFGTGRFTGDATDREDTKIGFRGNKKDYANNQGNLWATTVSPAGKEGVDFGNAHYMIHFDQEWNPQKTAQFTARVRRSDSAKTHAQVDRANTVRVESLHMPGTVEDFMFNAQDTKMASINQVTQATKHAEQSEKLGDTQGTVGQSYRGFSRGKRNKAGAKKQGLMTNANRNVPLTIPTNSGTARKTPPKKIASADKSLKMVILL